MSDPVDVVVAGAGPTGLMLAAELLRHGLTPLVVDREPAPSPLSRAIVVHARTLEVLDGHGLADPLVARGVRLVRARIFGETRLLVDVAFGGLPTRWPFLLSVPQCDTEDVLFSRVCALGGAVRRGVAVEGLAQDGDGVDVSLSDGGTVRARWLVGCDGAHSQVRHLLGLAFDGHAYDQRLILGDVVWDTALPRDALTSFVGDRFLACFPLPNGRWRLIATRDEAEDEEPVTLATLQALVDARARVSGTDVGALSDPAWLAAFRIHARQVGRYRLGRVLLAGDAAHIHSPAGGQGMNTGIQDAHNLGWKLALVDRGAPDRLLDSYEAERLPVAAHVLRTTGLGTRIGTVRNPVARAVRDAVAPALAALSLVRDRVTRAVAELDVAYRASPVVVDASPDPGPRAGDPVVRGDSGPPLHGVALIRGPATDPAGERRLRICAALTAADPRLRQIAPLPELEAHADAVAVVRPDGYLGLRLSPADPERLLAWLDLALGPAPAP